MNQNPKGEDAMSNWTDEQRAIADQVRAELRAAIKSLVQDATREAFMTPQAKAAEDLRHEQKARTELGIVRAQRDVEAGRVVRGAILRGLPTISDGAPPEAFRGHQLVAGEPQWPDALQGLPVRFWEARR